VGAHGEERFIMAQKHSKKAEDEREVADKQKELSHSKQRDQKIYLTQEVWMKKDMVSRPCQKFLMQMLTRDVNHRLGCGPNNFDEVKSHEFFEENKIDFDRVEECTATAPYIPKKEVNAKDESKMKTFNTAGMKKLNKEDQDKWSTWDWTSVEYFQTEMATYLYEQWGLNESKKGKAGAAAGGGCCELS